MASALRNLLSSIPLGHTTAKNRIVSTPHGAAYGERGGLTDRYIRYHEEKAKGGCGVVMMFGSSSIHPTSVNDWAEINNWDDNIIPQFQQMSAAIHRHGALCLSQISHRGRRGHSWYSGTPLWAPSDTREERHREWPHVMTKLEIREVIDAWAAAAVRLKKGGYDGCDIPIYGGHLLENFLSPLANTRTDEYGGSLDNRMRLLLRVVEIEVPGRFAFDPVGCPKCVVVRIITAPEGRAWSWLSGAVRAAHPGRRAHHDRRGRPHHRAAASQRCHCAWRCRSRVRRARVSA